ncbi:MAG: suppressor of fused domain protein [Chryseolinea sp.]
MNIPAGIEAPQYLELCILLPHHWQIEERAFSDENVYWPVRWLKMIARFPHSFNTWVGAEHTIPNGENADPFADATRFGCMMLFPSVTLGAEFYELKTDKKTINFNCLYPLYKEEMDFKLKHGTDNLLDKLEQAGIGDIVDPIRKNVCEKKGLFGLW